MAAAAPLRILSWNVNGLRSLLRTRTMSELVRSLGEPDILCLQETKMPAKVLAPGAEFHNAMHVDGYESFWSSCEPTVPNSGSGAYSGVVTFAKLGLTIDARAGFGVLEFDREGRVVVTHHGGFVLVNGYFPNASTGLVRLPFKDTFLEHISARAASAAGWFDSPSVCASGELAAAPTLLMGDLNVVRDVNLDLYSADVAAREPPGLAPSERAWIARMVDSGWVDTLRLFYPETGGLFTWWDLRTAKRASNQGWRLDYALAARALAPAVTAAGTRPDVIGSDHCPITVELAIAPPLPRATTPALSSLLVKPRLRQATLAFGSATAKHGPPAADGERVAAAKRKPAREPNGASARPAKRARRTSAGLEANANASSASAGDSAASAGSDGRASARASGSSE